MYFIGLLWTDIGCFRWYRLVFEFPEAEQEEHNRIGREYTRQSLIRQNKMDHDLTNKIWLQQEAIRALPEHLREHAMKIDVTPPPADRPWPYFETPPIKGFDIYKYVANESEDDEESENGENKDKTTPVVTTSV